MPGQFNIFSYFVVFIQTFLKIILTLTSANINDEPELKRAAFSEKFSCMQGAEVLMKLRTCRLEMGGSDVDCH